MADKNRVIQKTISYTGLFKYRDLFRKIDFWLRDKFFDKKEMVSGEYRDPQTGQKQIQFFFEPWKKVTDYYKITMRIELLIKNMKEVEIEMDGKKQRLNHGQVEVIISSYLTPDYENRMEKKDFPFLTMVKEIWERGIYVPIKKKYIEMAVDDCNDLVLTIQSYLHTFPKKGETSFESGRENTRFA